jgi:uncharacterized protein (TIGR00255 family)
MIYSMTAFSREAWRGPEGELVWELRSVNHRFLEVFVRLPEELRGLEPAVRDRAGRYLKRGKLDCTLRYRAGAGGATLTVNQALVQGLREAAEAVGELLGQRQLPSVGELLRWPGVLQEEPADLSPVQARALELLDRSLADLARTRQREGERLAAVILQRCEALRTETLAARERMPDVLQELRTRVAARLEEVLGQLDSGRLEQEMVLLAQRQDVDEELDRLLMHLDEVVRVVQAGGAVGRRLDFLMQELNRETNTLTSKTGDVAVTRRAVDMKVLIEQVREQVQNLE